MLIVFFGGASLWMGWQLFLRMQVEQAQKAELSFKDISVKLQRVGPGVFFALFGSVLLGWMTYDLPSFKNQPTSPPTNQPTNQPENTSATEIRMLGSADRELLEREIVALNLAYTTALKDTPQEISNWSAFNKSAAAVAAARNRLLVARFGPSMFALWQQHQAEFRNGGQSLSTEVREKVRTVDNLASKLSP